MSMQQRRIKFKTIDNKLTELMVDEEITVEELKEELEKVFNRRPNEQRLLCKGKLMKDGELVKQYVTEDDMIVHLMFRDVGLGEGNVGSNTNTTVNNGTGNGNGMRTGIIPNANSLILEVPFQNGRMFIPLANHNANQTNLNFNIQDTLGNMSNMGMDMGMEMNQSEQQELPMQQQAQTQIQPHIHHHHQHQQNQHMGNNVNANANGVNQGDQGGQMSNLLAEIPMTSDQQFNINDLIQQLTQSGQIPSHVQVEVQAQIPGQIPIPSSSSNTNNNPPQYQTLQSPFISLFNQTGLLPPMSSNTNINPSTSTSTTVNTNFINDPNFTPFNSTVPCPNDQAYHSMLNTINENISRLFTLINKSPNDLKELPLIPLLNSNQNFLTALGRSMRNYSMVLQQSQFSLCYLTDLLEREQYITDESQRRLGNDLISKCKNILHYIDVISKDLHLILNRTNFGNAPNHGFYIVNGIVQAGVMPMTMPTVIQPIRVAYDSNEPIIETIRHGAANRTGGSDRDRTQGIGRDRDKDRGIGIGVGIGNQSLIDLKTVMMSEDKIKTVQLRDLGLVYNSNKILKLFTMKFIANLTIKDIIQLTQLNIISITRQREDIRLFLYNLLPSPSSSSSQSVPITSSSLSSYKSLVNDLSQYLSSHFFLYQSIEHRLKQPNNNAFKAKDIFIIKFDPLIKVVLNEELPDDQWEKQVINCFIDVFTGLIESLATVYTSQREGMMYCLENNIEGLMKELIGTDMVEMVKAYSMGCIRAFIKNMVSIAECSKMNNKNDDSNSNNNNNNDDVNMVHNEGLNVNEIFAIATLDKKRLEEVSQREKTPIEFSELYRNTTHQFDNN